MDSVPFFPDRASTMAGQVDNLYFAWLVLSGVVALAVAVLIVWFAIRYRQGSAAKRTLADAAEREKTMRRIEIVWTVVPVVLFLVMFVWSARVYYRSVAVPKDALPIYVVFLGTIAFAIYLPQVVLWLPKQVIPESVGCFKNPSGSGYICPP